MMTALDAWTLYDSALASDIWGLGSTVVIDAGEPQGGYYTTTAALALAVP
jgi:hypothetical protein